MSNENINPIHHSALGAVSSTTLGAVGGGLKTGAKTWLGTALVTALAFGTVAAVIAFTGGLGATAAVSALGTLPNALAWFAGFGVVGGAVGAVGGAFLAPLAGLVGGVKGGVDTASRIRDEKGAANMLDAQLSAYQAQAYAAQQATTIYAPSAANNNSFPGMNQAGSRIQADTAQNLGTINGMQLQRA